MPHQLYDTARIVPVLDRSDVGVVNPVGWRETDVNEVVAVHGRILAREFIHFLGTSVVPIDIGHDARNGLSPVLVVEVSVQVLSSIRGCCDWRGWNIGCKHGKWDAGREKRQ